MPKANRPPSDATSEYPGRSSSRMVPVPSPVMVTLAGFDRCKRNVSSVSLRRSPTTGTVTVFVVSPGAKVSRPETGR